MKILVLEDEFMLADMLEAELTGAGHTVLGPVATVAEALAIIAQTRPDLALVNINLKNGSKGTDLARELAKGHHVCSLFVSGQLLEARQHKDVALGYITKPYRAATILESVDLAGRIMDGEKPAAVPSGLELFNTRRPESGE